MTDFTNRRNFIKNIGLGAATISLPKINLPGKVSSNRKQFKRSKRSSDFIELNNGCQLEFLFSDDEFLGIGKVFSEGVQLRSDRLPMFVEVRNPDGVELCKYTIVDKQISGDKITLSFKMKEKPGGTMEWMLHTVRNRVNLADWAEEPKEAKETVLELEILPIERILNGQILKGFSYQYKYKSNHIPIYKLLDRSSWEISGSSVGNEFWMRNGVVESIVEFKDKQQFYSTEWYLPGIANPNIFQFHPLQTHLQGFTFTTSNEGTLFSWPNKVGHVRSLFEKRHHKDEIMHFHEHCNDLSLEFSTTPMEVLFAPGNLNRIGKANLHHQFKELVHEELHRQIGMKRERITTYGIIAEWIEPDFDKYTTIGLPKLLEAGVKTVFISNHCENVMNTWGLSNMCCNVDFKISKTVGEDKLRKFCRTAQKGGAKVEMWGNTALSTLTELFSHREGYEKGIKFLPYEGSIMEVIDKAESPWIRNPSNAIEADHYTPRFCALNLRDKDIRAYWMKSWKYFLEEIGIESIFLDSSFNMSSDKFHFRQFPDKNYSGTTLDQKDIYGKFRPKSEPPKSIETMYHEHLDWVVEMQKIGYQYCGEDLGVFGINRTGTDVLERAKNLYLWQESYSDFDEDAVRKAGYEPFDLFFKGMAYRTVWKLYWDIKRDKLNFGIEDPRAFKVLKIFNQVEQYLYNREILENENGVVYAKNGKQVLWSFSDFSFDLPRKLSVTELMSGKFTSLSKIKAKKNEVYVIDMPEKQKI